VRECGENTIIIQSLLHSELAGCRVGRLFGQGVPSMGGKPKPSGKGNKGKGKKGKGKKGK
jgi:hypothetical protein